MELTVLMPCLNEAETVGVCIQRAQRLLADNNIEGEVLISDNGSIDGSKKIARDLGARVVKCPVRGYGAALQHGLEQAKGKYVLMGDSDDSYHFDEAMTLIQELRRGNDICIGTRLRGRIMPGAMPFLNRFIGNPILSAIGKIFFKIKVSDFHCGMRAFRTDKVRDLKLVTTGMEWASEMIIKSRLYNLKISEVPVTLHKAGRSRDPHLKRWQDGWRHLRFMLLHAPTWLFIFPGMLMFFFGFLGEIMLARGPLLIKGVTLDVHSLLVMAFFEILGMQVIFTGVFATLYSHIVGILPYNERFHRMIKFFTLEELLTASCVLGLIGLGGFIFTLWQWYKVDFLALDYQKTMRYLIPSLTLITLAIQGVFNGFMLSLLFVKTKTVESLPL
jgi:glycosyltransferase involved in cell wall biosynthesis